MSWIAIIFAMTASAYLTTALMYGFIWWRRREAWAHLMFAVTAFGAAALAMCEVAEMRPVSAASFGSALRWEQICAWTLILLLTAFVHAYFRTGKAWLLLRVQPECNRAPTALAEANGREGLCYGRHHVVGLGDRIPWIKSPGRVDSDDALRPDQLRAPPPDVTQPKLAELDAQAHRNEAAHLPRPASLGEFSSALAHELKQPLTSILCNAQAAQLHIARDRVDLNKIRDILRDIVDDDKRASDIIDRLRALIRKDQCQLQRLDANELIRNVLRFMHHDLTGRAVQVVTRLAPGLPVIGGDRVQLQQVLINLILNAGDAMSQPWRNDRTLTIRTARGEGSTILISVADTGNGIPTGDEEVIFSAYHTTKPEGLGLGLSLSRSIVHTHGGRLWAERKTSGGATFHCTIPEWKESETTTGGLL